MPLTITDGPSNTDLINSHNHQGRYEPVSFILKDEATGHEVLMDDFYVDAMVPTKPLRARTRWFLRVVSRPQSDKLRDAHFFWYDTYKRKGFELPPDHPFCQLAQF